MSCCNRVREDISGAHLDMEKLSSDNYISEVFHSCARSSLASRIRVSAGFTPLSGKLYGRTCRKRRCVWPPNRLRKLPHFLFMAELGT